MDAKILKTSRMTIWENVRVGLDGLYSHKLRTFLTMLGIIFGVAAVVAMQSIGAGAKKELIEAIRLLGVNNIIVKALELEEDELAQELEKNPRQLWHGDADALKEIFPEANYVVPIRRQPGNVMFPKRDRIQVVGTTPELLEVHNHRLIEGRFLIDSDLSGAHNVAVISFAIKRDLFPLATAVGERIKIDNAWFTVVGVVSPPAGGVPGADIQVEDMSRDVYIPLETMRYRFAQEEGVSPLQEIIVQVADEKLVTSMSTAIGRVMQRRHRGAEDFSIIVPIELLRQSQQTQRIFNIVMGAIASISLLVGGIGIMNIMLSNVLERTREIGIRRAVGATRQDVITQFLIEAVMLSLIGGFIGIAIGWGMSWGITLYAGWTTVVGIPAIVMAFGVSSAVGILFGWWPAHKAASTDIINAIRYE